jgi:hypothetical protein
VLNRVVMIEESSNAQVGSVCPSFRGADRDRGTERVSIRAAAATSSATAATWSSELASQT